MRSSWAVASTPRVAPSSRPAAWLQATVTPLDRWEFNARFGFDDPKDGDVDDLAMEQNLVAGASARFKIFEPLTFGFEYTYFDTDYKELSRRERPHGSGRR